MNPVTETSEPTPTVQSEKPDRARGGLLPILAAVVLFAIALFIASQIVGVLYGMVFPAQAPLPANTTQLEHKNEAYGVDEWFYSSPDDACAVTRYYQQNGGFCIFAPGVCESGFTRVEINPGDNVARCSGDVYFSIFAMRWHANIAAGYTNGDPTRFRLSREVFWTGTLPLSSLDDLTPTPTP